MREKKEINVEAVYLKGITQITKDGVKVIKQSDYKALMKSIRSDKLKYKINFVITKDYYIVVDDKVSQEEIEKFVKEEYLRKAAERKQIYEDLNIRIKVFETIKDKESVREMITVGLPLVLEQRKQNNKTLKDKQEEHKAAMIELERIVGLKYYEEYQTMQQIDIKQLVKKVSKSIDLESENALEMIIQSAKAKAPHIDSETIKQVAVSYYVDQMDFICRTDIVEPVKLNKQ